MKFNLKKALSGTVAALIAITAFAAPVGATSYPAIGSKPDSQPERPIDHGIKPVYPLTDSKETLTYWSTLQNNAAGSGIKNLGDSGWWKNVKKLTGINVQFIGQHTTSGNETAFATLIASKNLPDIIEEAWDSDTYYTGGVEAAINAKKIMNLKSELELGSKGNMPFLSAYLEDNPAIKKQLRTSGGNYGLFPFVRPVDLLSISSGPVIRKDWLDSLNMDVPVTVADWEKALTAFKEKKGAKYAITNYAGSGATSNAMSPYINMFGPAFKFRSGWFISAESNYKTVAYGPATTGYRDFLTLMNKWYNAGLLDKDFPTMNNQNQMQTRVYNGQSGAFYGAGGGDVGPMNATMQAKDKKASLIGVTWPVMKAGDKIQYANASNLGYDHVSIGSAAISANTKNAKLAMQLLDFAYSPAGHVAYNFGELGVSYKMVDGKETYTDLVMNNKAGDTNRGGVTTALPIANALSYYTKGNYNGPFIQDPGYILQYYGTQVQKDALNAWTNIDKPNNKRTNVPALTPTAQEIKVQSSRNNAVGTYVAEMTTKFVMGREPLSNWDAYINNLNKLGLNDMVKAKQAQYERYLQK